MNASEAASYAARYDEARESLDCVPRTDELRRLADGEAYRQQVTPPDADITREELIGFLLSGMFPEIGDALAVLAGNGGRQ